MMSRTSLIFLLVALGVTGSFAQRETFDIISFIPPTGWERTGNKDVVAFTKYTDARTAYCTIAVYDSRPGTDDLQKEFLFEWNDLIKKSKQIELPAERKEIKGTNGWNAIAGEGISGTQPPYVAMLLSMVGFGRVASVLVYISDDQFEPEVDKFWTNMQMVQPASNPNQTIAPAASLSTGNGATKLAGIWRSACNDKTDISTITNSSGTGYSYWSMSTGGLRVRHMALFADGTINSYVGLYGFANSKTDRSQNPNIWGVYQYENGKGTVKFGFWDRSVLLLAKP